jgi:hypothetical protein
MAARIIDLGSTAGRARAAGSAPKRTTSSAKPVSTATCKPVAAAGALFSAGRIGVRHGPGLLRASVGGRGFCANLSFTRVGGRCRDRRQPRFRVKLWKNSGKTLVGGPASGKRWKNSGETLKKFWPEGSMAGKTLKKLWKNSGKTRVGTGCAWTSRFFASCNG